ncbi:hypothetical protein NIES2100_05290 [Calothrix sp. NIES-2100]|uniref:hypothetical protein n=1 Tax=Calothrix sp. NIES-2100 TaxID=1954172 RepID=UPI000B614B78|nr:hypothetical protein NIES2100_05290 [Calothrix sp. NIES-2100]
MLELPNKFYKWQEFDCFTLAQEMRSLLNLEPLPDFNWIYREYNKLNYPKDLVKVFLDAYAKQSNVDKANLVCLDWEGYKALGTVYQGTIIYIINKPIQRPIERLRLWIDSFWFY